MTPREPIGRAGNENPTRRPLGGICQPQSRLQQIENRLAMTQTCLAGSEEWLTALQVPEQLGV